MKPTKRRSLNRVKTWAHALIASVLPAFYRGFGDEPWRPSERTLRLSLALPCGCPYGELLIVDFDDNDKRARALVRCMVHERDWSACFPKQYGEPDSRGSRAAWGTLLGDWRYIEVAANSLVCEVEISTP